MYVIYVHLSMLTGKTSLPPNQSNYLRIIIRKKQQKKKKEKKEKERLL